MMAGIGGEAHALIAVRRSPHTRHERRRARREALIPKADDRSQLLERVVGFFQRRRLDLLQPCAHALRGILSRGARQPESLEVYDAAHSVRPKTRVKVCNISAHAMPDDARRRAWANFFQQRIE